MKNTIKRVQKFLKIGNFIEKQFENYSINKKFFKLLTKIFSNLILKFINLNSDSLLSSRVLWRLVYLRLGH